MSANSEIDEDKIDMEMLDIDLNDKDENKDPKSEIKYENIEKNGSLFHKPFCNGTKGKKDYDQDTIYSIPVVQDDRVEKDQYSPNQPKTPSSIKDFSALYTSIANDFKRKKSVPKHDKSGINGDSDSRRDSLKENLQSEENVETIVLTSTTTDPEIVFAKSIVEGDQHGVQAYLKTIRSPENVVTMPLSTQNIDYIYGGETTLTPIDLAIVSQQDEILDLLIEYCLAKIPEFEQHIKETPSPYRSVLFDKLVVKNPKIAEEYLNLHIDSIDTSECEILSSESDSAVRIDLAPFNKIKSVKFSQESLSTYKMLVEGSTDLIKHPVVETFIHLKWQKLNWLFYLSLLFRILFATITTASVLMSYNEKSSNVKQHNTLRQVKIIWAMLASYIPLFFIFILNIFRNRNLYIIHYLIPFNFSCSCKTKNARNKQISILIPNSRFLLQMTILSLLITIVSTIEINIEKIQTINSHLVVWLLLFAWIEVLFKVGECPCLGIYIYLLTRVAKDVILFLFSTISLLIAFSAISFILFESVDDFRQALFSSFKMITGSYEFLKSNAFNNVQVVPKQESNLFPGTTEIIFLLFFLIFTVCIFNILVGFTVINVKETLNIKEDFKITQMITNIFEIEDTFDFISNIFSKFGCNKNCITTPLQLLKNDDNMEVYMASHMKTKIGNPRYNLLNLNSSAKQAQPVFKQYVSSSSLISYSITSYNVPNHIIDNARPILDEKEDNAKYDSAKNNHEETNPDGYTSLYFNGDRSENDYEEVDQEKCNMMKSMKEAIMRELRKDLGRFVKSDKSSLGRDKNTKCVNVRPGLAMGVITLQAGARGERITLN